MFLVVLLGSTGSCVGTSALSGRQGLVDSLFDAGVGPNRPVLALAIQGTKVLIAGDFTSIGGVRRNYIAAFDLERATRRRPTVTAGHWNGIPALINAHPRGRWPHPD